MRLTVKQLTITNFKGIKNLVVDFNEGLTQIKGDNGMGKTTVFDAFTWCLFGKDSRDSADFSVKELDANNKPVHHLEHSVGMRVSVDGETHKFVRVYAEKWVRRRGSEVEELGGHTTSFFYDEVPMGANEYKAKVDSMVQLGVFKLLTSSTYFNSLKWEERRDALMKMAGVITFGDISAHMGDQEAKVVGEILNSGTTLKDRMKVVTDLKKKLKEEKDQVPSRIDELVKQMPTVTDPVFLEERLGQYKSQFDEVEQTITNQTGAYDEKNKEIQGYQRKLHANIIRMQDIQYLAKSEHERSAREAGSAHSEYLLTKGRYDQQVVSLRQEIDGIEKRVESRLVELQGIRSEWEKIAAETADIKLDPSQTSCPSCKRELPQDTIDNKRNTIVANWEKDRDRRLNDINEKGQRIKGEVERDTKRVDELKSTLADVVLKRDALVEPVIGDTPEFVFTPTEEYTTLEKENNELRMKVADIPVLDVSGLTAKRAEIQSEIDSIKRQLTMKELADSLQRRIDELKGKEFEYANQITALERDEHAISEYANALAMEVESRVNGKFGLVRWKMFDRLINGSVEPCCECTINGVPYPDLNSAAKIQAGLDIIKTMSEVHGHYLPVWVDNAESINDIPILPTQMVLLVVTKDKSLKIQ